MAEWTLKYADARGEIHQQVAEAGSEQELRDTQHRYALATTAGGLGVWDMYVSSGELRVLGNLKELLVGLTLTDSFLYRPAITEAP